MTAQVTYLTPEKIEELKYKHVIGEREEDIELDPVAGLKVLGTLTEEEKHIFIEMSISDTDLQEFGKELYARGAERFAVRVREANTPRDLYERLQEENLFEDDKEAEEYFAELSRIDYLKQLFWWSVRDRLQTFATRLTIRAGFTVCQLGYKYKR